MDIVKIIRLRELGYGYGQIARLVHVSKETVRRVLKTHPVDKPKVTISQIEREEREDC